MTLRKFLVSALCAVCAVSLLVPAAFAHGGGCHRRSGQPCPVASCTVMGWHYHNGTAYCGHNHNHGNGLCNGSCAPLCTVDGCTLAGRHYHSGHIYCGADHPDGYCGGGCPYTPWSGRHGHHGGRHGGC